MPAYLGRLVFVVSMLYHLMLSGSFKASKNQHGIFLYLNFDPGIFLRSLWKWDFSPFPKITKNA